jgi:hypothetical protein
MQPMKRCKHAYQGLKIFCSLGVKGMWIFYKFFWVKGFMILGGGLGWGDHW